MSRCRGCDATWTGTRPAHCPRCHQTWPDSGGFDRHTCRPAAVGQAPLAFPAAVPA